MQRTRTADRPRLPRHHPIDAGMQPGHDIQMLFDGHEAWLALSADLDDAQHAIAAEMYLMADDEVGEAFAELLARACRRGVTVRLVLDGLGCMSLGNGFQRRLRDAGVDLRIHAELRPNLPWHHFVRRNHRKVLLIDDHIVHVGGRNVSRDYYALTPGLPTWADVSLRVQGPLVVDMSRALRANWTGRKKRPATIRARPWRPISEGAVAVAALNHGHIRGAEASRRYLQGARNAQKSLLLAQSYFLPEIAMRRAIRQAAQRGVDVRVLIPDLAIIDVAIVGLASMHVLGKLLKRGVRVFVLQNRMLHAKFAVVDGKWWTAGSDNLDPISRQRNLEANVVGLGEGEAQRLTDYFNVLCTESKELTLQQWRNRPLWQRVAGALAWMLRAFL